MVADNPPQAGRPAPGKEKGAAPAGWGSQGPQLAERKRVARRSRATRASQLTLAFPWSLLGGILPTVSGCGLCILVHGP